MSSSGATAGTPSKTAATPRARPTPSTASTSNSTNTTTGLHISPRGFLTPRSQSSSTGTSPFSLGSPYSARGGTLSPFKSNNSRSKSASNTFLWVLLTILVGAVLEWNTNSHSNEGHYLLTTTSKTMVDPPLEFPFEQPSKKGAAVFYHVYFPPTPEGRDNSARIIQEQLQQLQQSGEHTLTVYYNTIGDATAELNHTHVQELCRQHLQTCIHMQHYQSGMEDLTLQRLHDFCSIKQDATPIVYLHNKGSYSTKPLNEAWRYQMTQSVVSPQCQQSISSSSDQCNLCGLWFSAERGMFMAGNMWRSQCSYVKELIAPRNFQEKMHQATAEAMMERLRYKLLMTMQEIRAGVFGIDRYATEFWIASHPSVRPCDFSKAVAPIPPGKSDLTDHFLNWLRQMGTSYTSPLKEDWFEPNAPHHDLPLPKHLQVSKFRDVRLREYFLLAGSLYRWYFLYQQAPPADSWVYRWFPDGGTWQEAVLEHGQESVAAVTAMALQQEVVSGRNRYTADRSVKPKGANKGGEAAGGAKGPAAKEGAAAKQPGGPKGAVRKRT